MTLRVGILAVGDELLSGDAADTNSPWLASLCRRHGHRAPGRVIRRGGVPLP